MEVGEVKVNPQVRVSFDVKRNCKLTERKHICYGCQTEFWTKVRNRIFCSRGCSKINNAHFIKDTTDRFFRSKITRLRSNASRRGITFSLTWEDLKQQYIAQNKLCAYTGKSLPMNKSLSIDRINNQLGYLKNNIVICHTAINSMKGEFTVEEFENMVQAIITRPRELKIELKHPDAKLPTRANPFDAGLDLYCVSRKLTPEYVEYDTGISIQLEKFTAGFIFPRSSIAKYDLALANSIGVVDYGYSETIKLRFKVTEDGPKIYEVGDRVGQLIVMPIPNTTIVEGKVGGDRSGFGSSGTN